MKTLVVIVLAGALAVVAAGPAPGPQPAPGAGAPGGGNSGAPVADQESQASENVSKRGAARLSAVTGNSISDNAVSSAPQHVQQAYSFQQQQQQQQPQLQQQQQQQQLQQPPQPLYASHPYSLVAPPQYQFQYQPALQALPQLHPMLHSKYHAPGKPVLQYVPQPYYVPQYQAPLMYIIPQPQPQPHHHPAGSQQPAAGQPEQPAPQPQQPHYVMVLQAPAPSTVAASGFQYFNHPLLPHQPQQVITFYAGPHAPLQHQQQPQHHQQQQTRFYPEQQQLVYQTQPESSPGQNDVPHFVPKNSQTPVGLEGSASSSPVSQAGSYGLRVQHQQQHQPQHQHAYKTIIKA